MIIPDAAFAKYGEDLWNKQLMYGTGPWVFKEWIDGQYVRLEKNHEYWNKAEYDPYYEEVYLRFILEPATIVAAHLAGDIQVNLQQSGVPKELRSLYSGTNSRIQEIERRTGQFFYAQFQSEKGKVFNDKNARMAFEYCLDRKSIVSNILDGDAELITSLIAEPVQGFDPSLPPYEYNVEKAKEYLKKSGYDGRKITVMGHTSLKKSEEILLATVDNMKAVGFNAEIELVDMSVFLELRATGKYDLVYALGLPSNNDATEPLSQRFDTGRDGHHYDNPEMHDLIEKLQREMDAGKRASYVTRISHIIRDEAAPATGVCSLNMTYYSDWGVSGIYYFRDGSVRMMYVDYDPSLVPK
jgi:peptide/nickel transport system substrate-binding protein